MVFEVIIIFFKGYVEFFIEIKLFYIYGDWNFGKIWKKYCINFKNLV